MPLERDLRGSKFLFKTCGIVSYLKRIRERRDLTINNIDTHKTIEQARRLLETENLSPATKAAFLMILDLFALVVGRLGANSRNSSKPPSSDPNRPKTQKSSLSNRKPGGQKGRLGTTLKATKTPDEIVNLPLSSDALPGDSYRDGGYEARQVVEIQISRSIIEYRAQILIDAQGKKHKASFPEGVVSAIQYGTSVKAHSCYLSQFQMLPYDRLRDYFESQCGISLSVGTIYKFNEEFYKKLEGFETRTKAELAKAKVIQVDETGINIGGLRHWLHNASNDRWVHFHPHEKRGREAMDEVGILKKFRGIAVHDHWKAYYGYRECLHALCNAHHLRELKKVIEDDKQVWAEKMIRFLNQARLSVQRSGGKLSSLKRQLYRSRYHKILSEGKKECPPPKERLPGQRGPLKKTKARNLLERLLNYKDDVLRFMDRVDVPFPNNTAERDIRMTKVQQKISGCFRSVQGAKAFCRARSYILTCQKQGITPAEALLNAFKGKVTFPQNEPDVSTAE